MKLKFIVPTLLLLIAVSFSHTQVFAESALEQTTTSNNYSYAPNKTAVLNSYKNVTSDDWKKYFNKQAKQIRKVWKKDVLLKNDKYKTSYARILFFVNKNGEILSYQIKSSCIPKDDKEFMQSVENAITKIGKFDSLPAGYNNNLIVFTVKFNSFISKYQTSKNIEWDRYGIADIEVSKNKLYLVTK